MRRVGLFSADKTILAELRVTLTLDRLPSHSGLLSLIVTGRGGEGEEAAEDDGKGQCEIHWTGLNGNKLQSGSFQTQSSKL